MSSKMNTTIHVMMAIFVKDGLFWIVFSVSKLEENFENPGAFNNYTVFNTENIKH